MLKSLLVVLLVTTPIFVEATQDKYAEIRELSLKGILFDPFETFHLNIALDPKDSSIVTFELAIDDRIATQLPKILPRVKGIALSTLVVTHSSVHAPESENNGIWGVGPAHLIITFKYYETTSCESGVGEIRLKTRMDSLDSSFDQYCLEESDA